MAVNTFIATTGNGLARASHNSNGDWSVEFLLGNQDVRCLAANPLSPNVVYAGTHDSGVLRSSDGGKAWQPAGLDGRIVKAIAVSHAEPGVVYAGTKSPPLMFVSHDQGRNWQELEGFRRIRSRWFWFSPAEPPFTAYVQSIALSPTDPDVIVVGIEAGAVVRSEDGGRTWQDHRPGALRDCHSLVFHAMKGDWVYEAGGSSLGAAVSHNTGKTWTQPKAGLDRHYGWAVAADPVRPEVWYVSLSPGPMKAHSENNAQAYIFRAVGDQPWQKLAVGNPEPRSASTGHAGLAQPLNYMPYALLTDPTAPGRLYAGLSNGDVWHSADHGDSWEKLPFNLKGIHRALIML